MPKGAAVMEVADELRSKLLSTSKYRAAQQRGRKRGCRRSDPNRSRSEAKIDSRDHEFIPPERINISEDGWEFSVCRSS
jgi:hypothetical protein